MTWFKLIKQIREKVGVIDKSTDGYKFRYADLISILEKLDPVLEELEIEYRQDVYSNEKGLEVKTVATHGVAGDREVPLFIPWDRVELQGMTAPQSAGGTITYFRRYGLTSLFNLITEEDADRKEQSRAEKKPLTGDQKTRMAELVKEAKIESKAFLDHYKKSSIDDFTQAEFRSVISILQKRIMDNGKL